MKILFLSDTQLAAGTELGNGATYGDGSRFHDQETVLERVDNVARDEGIELSVHLGDVFERREPAPHHIVAVQRWARNVNVIFLQGNHDVRSLSIPTALHIFGDSGDDVLDRPGLLPWRDVVFAALPWAPHADVEDLVAIAQELRIRCAEELPNLKPILLAHWAISGSTLPSGNAVEELLSEAVIPWTDLDGMGWALVAAGHIHHPQVIAAGEAQTPMFYAGSPMVMNWGEAESPHGVWVYDTEGPDLRFVAIEDRPFRTLRIDFADGEDFSQLYERYNDFDPERQTFSGSVVRVRYRCDEETAKHVDEALVRQVLLECGATKVLIKGDVERVSRARVEISDEEIGPTEALELWLAANDVDGRADLIREHHIRYLEAAR